MLLAYGDESHDQTKERVFVVAAVLGSEEAWEEFGGLWADRLGGRVFHAADCEAGYGEFRGMSPEDRQLLHLDLTQLLATSKLMGFGSAIDLAGCRRVAPSVIAQFPDMPYYDCFLKTVLYMSDLAAVFVPRDKLGFTFDRHAATQYNAGLLYDWITHYRSEIVEKVGFTNRNEAGIQAADLWARELMKRCDTHLFNDRANPRPQWRTIMNTRRFRFKFTLGGELASRMQEAETIVDIRHEGYEQWRSDKKLVDNLSNRFRYFTALEAGQHKG